MIQFLFICVCYMIFRLIVIIFRLIGQQIVVTHRRKVYQSCYTLSIWCSFSFGQIVTPVADDSGTASHSPGKFLYFPFSLLCFPSLFVFCLISFIFRVGSSIGNSLVEPAMPVVVKFEEVWCFGLYVIYWQRSLIILGPLIILTRDNQAQSRLCKFLWPCLLRQIRVPIFQIIFVKNIDIAESIGFTLRGTVLETAAPMYPQAWK